MSLTISVISWCFFPRRYFFKLASVSVHLTVISLSFLKVITGFFLCLVVQFSRYHAPFRGFFRCGEPLLTSTVQELLYYPYFLLSSLFFGKNFKKFQFFRPCVFWKISVWKPQYLVAALFANWLYFLLPFGRECYKMESKDKGEDFLDQSKCLLSIQRKRKSYSALFFKPARAGVRCVRLCVCCVGAVVIGCKYSRFFVWIRILGSDLGKRTVRICRSLGHADFIHKKPLAQIFNAEGSA